MVTRSLFTGVSGLQSHLSKMDTISDNVSNINTPGFKKSQTVFKSFLSQTLSSASRPSEQRGGTNPQQVGLGVEVGTINKDMSQGQLQRTGVNTDLAIQGEGFFEVRESGGNNSLFTRAGSFQIDANGRLVDPSSGNVVQGFNSTVEDGEINFNPETATVEDIQITSAQEVIPGEATTQQSMSGNLAANAEKGIESVNVAFENSEVRFEFERYHPTEKMYRFEAKWAENPASGKQIGDNVTDQITGQQLQGIMELNSDGQVTDLYKNPDLSGNIGATRVETDRNNAGNFNISGESMSIRDQSNFMNDLAPDVTDQFRMRFVDEGDLGGGNGNGEADEFVIEWRDSDGAWNSFNNFQNATTGNSFGEVGEEFVMQRTTPGGDQRLGEIRINSGFWNDTDASSIASGALTDGSGSPTDQGDKIYFQTHAGDSNEILNQTGEEAMQEFRWGGQNSAGVGSYRESSPETALGSGTLDSVFNYDERNIGIIGDSNQQNDIQNKEFTIGFNGAGGNSFHAATNLNGNKGNESAITDTGAGNDAAAGDTNVDVANPAAFAQGDLVEFEDPNTGNREFARVTATPASGAPAGTIDIDTDTTTGGNQGLDNGYDGANGASITNHGQMLTNQNGELAMANSNDNLFFTENTAPVAADAAADDTLQVTDADATNFSVGERIRVGTGANSEVRTIDQINDLGGANTELAFTSSFNNTHAGDSIGKEIGVSVSSENWTGTADNDKINFQLTQARSSDSGRPFMVASDGDGNETALFAPGGGSGGSAQPSNINFGPNLNDTSGILNDTTGTFTDLLASSGSAAEAEAKTDDEVQVATSSDVFDSLGDQHTLTYRFEKKDTNEWMWHAENPTPTEEGNPDIAGFGRLTFNERGNLEQSETFQSKVAQELPPPGPQGDLQQQRVYFNPPEGELQSDPSAPDSQNQDVGAEPVSILPDFADVTQFAGETDIEISDQDGTSRGRLESLSFDSSGVLNGSYDNGDTEQLAQTVLADFRNPGGLNKEGGTYFSQSANSGIPTRGTPGSGGRGSITPGALERSNVDLSSQFTELISTQRGFQANTRTITTSDQLIQSVLQLV